MRAFVLLLCLLFACSPQAAPPAKEVVQEQVSVQEPVVEKIIPEEVRRTVKQTRGGVTTVYGLTEDSRILSIERLGELWKLNYVDRKIDEITGKENVEFLYKNDKLAAIDLGAVKLNFEYGYGGKLESVTGGKENLYFDHDSKGRLRAVRRGAVVATKIDYTDERISNVTRGPKVINAYYDDKGRLRNLDGDDTKFIFGYWRDDKLISLTGKTVGQAVTISYGPGYPAFEASIIHPEDTSTFTSAYTDALYKIVDEYTYCKYVRRLKELEFEGQSYAFFANYFNGTPQDYIAMNYYCEPYET